MLNVEGEVKKSRSLRSLVQIIQKKSLKIVLPLSLPYILASFYINNFDCFSSKQFQYIVDCSDIENGVELCIQVCFSFFNAKSGNANNQRSGLSDI